MVSPELMSALSAKSMTISRFIVRVGLFLDKIEFVAVRVAERRVAELRQLEFLHNRRAQRDQTRRVAIEVSGFEVKMHAVSLRRHVLNFLELERRVGRGG